MTAQTVFFDRDTCTTKASFPGSNSHIAAVNAEGGPVVIAYEDLSRHTLSRFSFQQLAQRGMELFRANGKWHAQALH